MVLEINFLALIITIFLVTRGESRHILEVHEAPPVHSETSNLPEPTLPVPKVEHPPVPKVELPPLLEIPKITLPLKLEIPKVELPPLPEIPKVTLPLKPEIPAFVPEIPEIQIPESIPELPIPFAPPHAKESP
jgi:hypothetical protein